MHALRYYEGEKLLISPVGRTSGGRRVYQQADVDWLNICTRLRASGMPLTELRRFATLVRHGPGNEDQRLALLREHQARVQTQLDELHACADLITWKVGAYEEQLNHGSAQGMWDPTQRDTATPPIS